tara:strand:+ start:328 stop:753 length:426 start_codon:yes stop_codon:yes gene_type:complete
MKAKHEFKTESDYMNYLTIYFSSKLINNNSPEEAVSKALELVAELRFATKMQKEKSEKKEVKPILERKKDFAMSIQPYLDKYGKKMLNEFYAYWTEETQGKDKLRVELQKTWNVERRLSTWNENNSSFTKTATTNNLQGTI